MKILITGGSGLLGQYLNKVLLNNNEILTTYKTQPRNCINYKSVKLNINDYKDVEDIFVSFSPDIVIHTAAVLTNSAEENLTAKEIYMTNVNATQNLAALCNKYKAKLIYTSTDLVYAGYRGSMLKEEAKIIPISIYAETKLMGEVKIRETFDNFIILRTALLYGLGLNGKENHFHRMYNKLNNGEPVKLFSDQFRTPISLIDAARIIGILCEKDIKSEIMNLGGHERLSRFELGCKLCEAAGFDKNLLRSVSMDDLPDYPQVADVSLNTDKLQSFGITQKSVEKSLSEIFSPNS